LPGKDKFEILDNIVCGSSPIPHLNDPNIYGDTALIAAVIYNNVAAAKLLLDIGADPNIRGEYNIVATQYTLYYGKFELLALLTDIRRALPKEIAVDEE